MIERRGGEGVKAINEYRLGKRKIARERDKKVFQIISKVAIHSLIKTH